MTIAAIFQPDHDALIGRDPSGIAEDYGHENDLEMDLIRMEFEAMESLIRGRAGFIAPTRARDIAIQLMPAVATSCRTMQAVDMMLGVVCRWIEDMGDVRRHARFVSDARGRGTLRVKTSLCLPLAFNADAVFDVHDASTLAVTLHVHRRPPVIVGMHMIDQDDGERSDAGTPVLVA